MIRQNRGNDSGWRQAWRQRKDSPMTLGIAMAAIAIVFIIGIVTAFNNARLDSIAHNAPPAQTAQAPATKAPQAKPETTGSGTVTRPARPASQNTQP